jgi:hypothetical protein
VVQDPHPISTDHRGQVEGRPQPAEFGILQGQSAAVKGGNFRNDIKAETGSRHRFIEPGAARQHSCPVLGCQVRPVVFDGDFKPPALGTGGDSDPFAGPFAGIVHQIAEHLFKVLGIAPKQIKLEITESLLMDNLARAAVTLNGVKALGLEIAIDDFGTGYSSLSYLHRFHIDTLKIDRSFVSTATMNTGSMEVVRAVAGLARNLGLDIVGEGIEQPEQMTLLRDLQCEYGQGYFFSKPVAADAIIARLEREHGTPESTNIATFSAV